MSTIAEYGAAGPASAANCDPEQTLIVDASELPSSALVLSCGARGAGCCLFVALPRQRTLQDVAQLERLAPQIERAQTLSPEAREPSVA